MIDETGYGEEAQKVAEQVRKQVGVRAAVMNSLANGDWFSRWKGPLKRIINLGCILRWGIRFGMGRKKRIPLQVDQLVGQWIEAIVGMCLAHDKDSYDAHDAKADDLLGPLLTAPVKQVREFYQKLRDKLESDKRVPWMVWMGFEIWGEAIVKNASDEGVKRLKNKLAGEIADLVEMEIRDQIPEAIKRALRWRDAETLQEVKEKLESGVKPKLRGRESCLFLEAGRGKRKVSVQL